MVKQSKRYREAFAKVDRNLQYDPSEAFDLLKSLPAPKRQKLNRKAAVF